MRWWVHPFSWLWEPPGWVGEGYRETAHGSSLPWPGRCCSKRDSSISAAGIPGQRKGSPGGLCGRSWASCRMPTLILSQQQPQALWGPWWCCDKQSIHFLLSSTGLSGTKRYNKSKTLPRIYLAEFRKSVLLKWFFLLFGRPEERKGFLHPLLSMDAALQKQLFQSSLRPMKARLAFNWGFLARHTVPTGHQAPEFELWHWMQSFSRKQETREDSKWENTVPDKLLEFLQPNRVLACLSRQCLSSRKWKAALVCVFLHNWRTALGLISNKGVTGEEMMREGLGKVGAETSWTHPVIKHIAWWCQGACDNPKPWTLMCGQQLQDRG